MQPMHAEYFCRYTPLCFAFFFLYSNVSINIHEFKDIIDCIVDHYEKKRCKCIFATSGQLAA